MRSWLIIITLLLLPATLLADVFGDAVKEMREQLGAGFLVRQSGIFICAGNLPKREFDAIVDGTVTRGAEALWGQYFVKKPTYPIRVYLFADKVSYDTYARALFGDADISPFGYYKPDKKALVMNIATGTGTLVHEMTHALMAPDFPDAPTWFSEGIASLYEQCRFAKGGLTGMVNWRLPVLRAGQQKKTTLPLAKLIATSREEFLDENLGVHYAQARYFCFYLQEHGKLVEYYRTFRDNYTGDPTGAKSLVKVLKKPVAEVEKDWLKWVKGLSEE